MWPAFVELLSAFPGIGSEPALREQFEACLRSKERAHRLYTLRSIAFGIALVVSVLTVFFLMVALYARPIL